MPELAIALAEGKMSESGDYDPGPWSGYDFKSARKKYDVHVGKSYDDAKASGKDLSKVLEKTVSTDSESPLVIACDVTGSMGDWPATIFSKLPYLDLEGKEYLGKNMQICFAAIGDAYCDEYALQVRPFDNGKNLEKRLKELIIEGGGGGQISESYDLCALYFARNVSMPNAVKPILIIIGDEGLYDMVDKAQAKKYAKIDLESKLTTAQIFNELKNKYSVYLVRKPYDRSAGDGMSSTDKKIYDQWATLLGEDHISILPGADRVVDVIFGILAKETSREDYFKEEITERQKPEQVKTVMKALDSIYTDSKISTKKDGKSVMNKKSSGKLSKMFDDAKK